MHDDDDDDDRQLDRQATQASQRQVPFAKLAEKFSAICRTLRIITIFLNSLPVDSVPNVSQMNQTCTHINLKMTYQISGQDKSHIDIALHKEGIQTDTG